MDPVWSDRRDRSRPQAPEWSLEEGPAMPLAVRNEAANGRRRPPAALLALALAAGLTVVSPSSSARAMSDHEPGEVFRDCETCPEMVVIPAGSW